MRLPVADIAAFYATPLGRLVLSTLRHKLAQAWQSAPRLRVIAYGHAAPLIEGFTAAERRGALIPEAANVTQTGGVAQAVVAEAAWPLPDASVDRLVMLHALEEAADARRVLREAWRVLADDGLMILIVANRRSLWAMIETSPFAAGRPYSRSQLCALLSGAMFEPTAVATALHFLPIPNRAALSLAPGWERLGGVIDGWGLPRILPNIAGVNLIEARKAMARPIGTARAELLPRGRLIAAPQGVQRLGATVTKEGRE